MSRVTLPLLAIVAVLIMVYFVTGQHRATRNVRPPETTRYWEPPVGNPPTEAPAPPAPNPQIRAFYDAVEAEGGKVYLVAKPKADARFVHVRVAIPPESIVVEGDNQYADVDLGEVIVRVAKSVNPSVRQPIPAPRGRLLLTIPGTDDRGLSSFFLVKTFSQPLTQASPGPARIKAVSVFDVKDDGTGAVLTESLQVPDDETSACFANALDSAANITGSVVVVPPLRVDDCSSQYCADLYTHWMHGYHDAGIVLRMLEHLDTKDEDERRLLWNQPWGDEEGDEVKDTSLAFYFGKYAEHRFDGILSTYRRLHKRMKTPGTWTLPNGTWTLTCVEGSQGECIGDTKAYHKYRGDIHICVSAFSAFSESDFYDPDRDGPSTMVHEALHFMWVPLKAQWRVMKDRHKHKHGPECNRIFRQVPGYEWCNVRHLATYPAVDPICEDDEGSGCSGCSGCVTGDDCNHPELAARNNDTYALVTAEIGSELRKGVSHHWPSLGEGLSLPESSNCTVTDWSAELFADPLEACSYVEDGGTLDCGPPEDPSEAGYVLVCE
jgi:hypothetical protein